MREAQCVRYPIKPGQRETMVNWIARLKDRSAEVTEAMAEAGLVAEAVFLERSADGDHVLIYTDTKDLTAANEALARSRLPLVREFNQLMAETVDLEKAVVLDPIYRTP